jgi:hypothetical protein
MIVDTSVSDVRMADLSVSWPFTVWSVVDISVGLCSSEGRRPDWEREFDSRKHFRKSKGLDRTLIGFGNPTFTFSCSFTSLGNVSSLRTYSVRLWPC